MRTSLSIVIILLGLVNAAKTQELVYAEVKNYTNAKIKLTSGLVVNCKSLTLHESSVDFITAASTPTRSFQLDRVEEISIATKNNAGMGFLIGTAVGGAAMLIAQKIYEEPETTVESGYGWTRTTTETKFMSPGVKVAIVGGGALLGALVGSATKGGWKTIYPEKDSSLSFNIQSNAHHAMLNLQLCF